MAQVEKAAQYICDAADTCTSTHFCLFPVCRLALPSALLATCPSHLENAFLADPSSGFSSPPTLSTLVLIQGPYSN